MVNNKWKLVKTTPYAKVYVEPNKKKTKIETFKYIYYHKYIYPNHNPDYFKRYKK